MIIKSSYVRILACLLCLLVVGGALDTLPDPPALKPQSTRKNPVSQLLHHIAVATQSSSVRCLACGPRFQAGLIPSAQSFEVGASSHDPFVLQATDASPPLLSWD